MVEEIVRTWGAVHHLVNCVAYFGSKDLDSTEEDWDMTMNITFQHAGSILTTMGFLQETVTEGKPDY